MAGKPISEKTIIIVVAVIALLFAVLYFGASAKAKAVLNDNNRLKTDIAELNQKITQMGEQVNTSLASAEEKISEIETLKNELEQERANADQLKQQIDSLEGAATGPAETDVTIEELPGETDITVEEIPGETAPAEEPVPEETY